jgi:polyphosphate kinase 2 (PPK2 family)
MLDTVDLKLSLPRKKYDAEIPVLQMRLRELHWACFQKRIPAVIVFEGWDAAGKGGTIKRITQILDPRGYEVISIAAPRGEDQQHPFLWRFWRHLPKAGHFTIFDRSWYGRVMVERVEGFCTEDEWRRAYREINEFERHLTNFGTVLFKFWLHISRDEQLRRFRRREKDPYRSYKLTAEDWRNREKWGQYRDAVDEMLERTSTTYAPWSVVESNDKLYGRAKVLRTVVGVLEKALDGPGLAKRLRKREKRVARLVNW